MDHFTSTGVWMLLFRCVHI